MGDGRPDREVYRSEKNEVEQQFAQHNLDRDMKADYAAFTRVKTKEDLRQKQAENRGMILLLGLCIGALCLAFAVF